MLRSDLEDQLRDRSEDDGYLFPAYDSFCFANVPHTVASILGAETGRTLPDEALAGVETDVENVLVVLIDGLGLNRWKSERDDVPLLKRLTERGTVTPLTSVYPSETAAAMTTYHTGALPAEHGVIGWNVYEPTVGTSFLALPFVDKDGNPPAGLEPGDVADAEPWVVDLERDVDVHYVTGYPEHEAYATNHEYESLEDLGSTLEGALDAPASPSYTFAYVPHVDVAAHQHGTTAEQYREALAQACAQLEDALATVDRDTAEETLVLVTADHGHVDTDPDRNVDLTEFDVLEESLERGPDGDPIRYAGSPRNVHLHLREGTVERVRDALRGRLDARVVRRETVLEKRLFGDCEPSTTFGRRLGDLVVSHRELGVWYGGDYEPEELELVGMHGGLNPAEMLVPLAACRLSALQASA
ncbi:alkaline phosphatase family protein [Halopiger xanaduensis]|uniref:Type I phosphodiesterase/nucleotide pyrophosphatase n=1 Tax=Halopiger xanaduensis (strain DSM 18323 / JCM 14033 / SH-6) TaxID=797210 RepID=F8D444_HALXS|nr:nucleotide pyrophosphatase/phosphodiesterase family protein [Halopiger xanaduensis]AEH37443.1 type I phosphodiesterase/nucleotide pyrophosphatase [Halopiger xanaduensis SH-6]